MNFSIIMYEGDQIIIKLVDPNPVNLVNQFIRNLAIKYQIFPSGVFKTGQFIGERLAEKLVAKRMKECETVV